METEYRITYKRPDLPHWGQLPGYFENYPDAKAEFERVIHEGSSGTYRIIKITYTVALEDEVK